MSLETGFMQRLRWFSHGGLNAKSFSNATVWPVRDLIHCWPSGKNNGMLLYELISLSLNPAKSSFPKDEEKAGVILVPIFVTALECLLLSRPTN